MQDFTAFMELIACIVAFSTIRFSTPLLLYVRLSVLLAYCTERVAIYYSYELLKKNNLFLFNIYVTLDMINWTFIFYQVHPDKKSRRFILSAALVYFGVNYYNLVYGMGWNVMPINPFLVFAIFVILFAMLYFYRTNRMSFHDPMKDPVFWVCAACFFYFSISFMVMALKHPRFYYSSFSNSTQYYLLLFSNGFYYLLLSFSFVLCYYTCSRPAQASSLTSSSSPAL